MAEVAAIQSGRRVELARDPPLNGQRLAVHEAGGGVLSLVVQDGGILVVRLGGGGTRLAVHLAGKGQSLLLNDRGLREPSQAGKTCAELEIGVDRAGVFFTELGA